MHRAAAQPLTIDRETRRLADEMAQARETMETIVAETLQSAELPGPALESGRTACGSARNQRGPLARYPRAVDLSACPRNRTGLWHTHPSRDELNNPSLSLPDMALVVWEGVDVHYVVGTDTAERMVAPVEREAFQAQFADALGFEANGPGDIVREYRAGRLNPDEAGERIRAEFPRLFERVPTGLRGVASAGNPAALPAHAPLHACTHVHSASPDVGNLRTRSRSCARGLRATAGSSDISLRDLAISQTVGTVVGSLANEFIVQRTLGLR